MHKRFDTDTQTIWRHTMDEIKKKNDTGKALQDNDKQLKQQHQLFHF